MVELQTPRSSVDRAAVLLTAAGPWLITPQLFDEYARPKPLQVPRSPSPLAHLFERRA
jgi:hypothetical protein